MYLKSVLAAVFLFLAFNGYAQEIRTFNGTGNNPVNSDWGKAGAEMEGSVSQTMLMVSPLLVGKADLIQELSAIRYLIKPLQ
ncbi:MAG: hypothetical protein HKN16_01630 [Saprospiraceae bacterium]|nr:hypothetical protein [Saprospiraceae bacterium]